MRGLTFRPAARKAVAPLPRPMRMMEACEQGEMEVVRRLIDQGAHDLDARDEHGCTPLLACCVNDNHECASLLLANGAGVNERGRAGKVIATPLYAAASVNSTRCAELLCEAGAHLDTKASDGRSPLICACCHGHAEAAALLSSYGADREAHFVGCLPHGSAAEAAARANGHASLAEWLGESATWQSPLQYVEVLSEARAVKLLRGGKESPVRRCPSPASRARRHPHTPAAQLILRAAAPWSPARHQLWGHAQRARARELCHLGYLLAYRALDPAHACSFADAWLEHVMPRVIWWDGEREDKAECGARPPTSRDAPLPLLGLAR